ncbi:hypothetical protein Nepgr_011973 [Nepenthes gracilis]|uniref:Uncharacterized protein n=1 Tax=Nepenthes gracilis TaxID=150966 RepID=A0AAD3SFA1_NEPGR|nr:hypothetical protein Nepgr_011973 [Nepenthes gracilis]
MEESMASLCAYNQEGINELKTKLLYTATQLESEKFNAEVEIGKQKEHIDRLIQLLRIANKERDEARHSLQRLLSKYQSSFSADTTETYGFYGHNSHDSPPLPVSIVGNLSNFGTPKQDSMTGTGLRETIATDTDDEMINHVVKGKTLPQKGKLLEAVLEAGPLLQTLLATGSPLPQWQNPPPLQPVVGIGMELKTGFD